MKKDNQSTYDFSVFDNYKCDGQLRMEVKDNKIIIKEEKEQSKSSIDKRI